MQSNVIYVKQAQLFYGPHKNKLTNATSAF